MTILANALAIALATAAEVVAPPPPVDFVGWAKENIVFSRRESEFPGPYNPDLFPYFSEVLRALSPEDPCRTVTLKGSAQIGKTVVANVFTVGSQALDPCDFLYVHPTEDNATRWSKLKLKPMLQSTASVAALFPTRSRDGGDSILFKERVDGRGSILISGANSPASLSQVSMPRQVQDDLSKWENNDKAGDPETQAESRSSAFEFGKILKISTPLINPGCRISRNYLAGSQEVYLVPCPHCSEEQTLDWDNMLANLDEERPEDAHFTCIHCGVEIREHYRRDMVRKGRWHAQNPKAARIHRSFYLWAAYGPLQSWERIAAAWLTAKGDPASEQAFLNDMIGRAYEAKGEAPPWEALRDRAAVAGLDRGIVPAWCVLLTLGIDCQKDRVEWSLLGWGRDFRRYVIDADIVTGHISEPECQAGLDRLLAMEFRHEAGRKLGIDLAGIDGNAWTEDVWSWVRKHPAAKVIMLRGVASESAPLLMRVKKERNRRGELVKYSRRFYHFGSNVLKLALYRNLAKTDPTERGYVGFAKGLPDEYFRQVTAEHRTAVKGPKARDGFPVWKWVKDPNQANEGLDTNLQAEAAAIKLGVRMMPEAVWDRLEAERASPPPDDQLDLEDLMSPTAAAAPRPQPAAKSTPASALDRLAGLNT